jgi:hypothetical protein
MEKQSPSIREASDLHEDWSTLIARAADNVSRIIESEIHLFETASGRPWKGTSIMLWRAWPCSR